MTAARSTKTRQAVVNVKKQLDEILADERIRVDCAVLPSNYNFEMAKVIWKVRSTRSKRVALQFPEGLLLYACVISDIIRRHTDADTLIMGDVTYGACCVDDYTARMLGCDLLVHYGHSCLVPIQETPDIHMLYVFVDIALNTQHFVDTLRYHFPHGTHLALVSTVQFVRALHVAQRALTTPGEGENGERTYKVTIPQARPLSAGEILGCTSPRLPSDVDALVYLGDGRFHLESSMIQNPGVSAYQYDPYSKAFTSEQYDHELMKRTRAAVIEKAKSARTFGLILGTLGHQGNTRIFDRLQAKIEEKGGRCVPVLMSEIFPQKLDQFDGIECWVQVACPRLSIDWGEAFTKPLLTPYELNVALAETCYCRDGFYPMDYYANEASGPWTNNHTLNRPPRQTARMKEPVVIKQQ